MSEKLRAGDLVQVRSKEEILSTLDRKGQLRGLSFMPEMFQHCGKRLRVYKRAHKTCDTVNHTGGRWLGKGDAVHLEATRCGGENHGGCQAGCMIFWWQDWLKKVPESGASATSAAGVPGNDSARTLKSPRCTEADVTAATIASEPGVSEPIYSCQVTQLPQATTYLPWWDIRQYVEDYASGNVGLRRLFCGFMYASVYSLKQMRGGTRILKIPYLYDKFQAMVGGIKFPRHRGTIPKGEKTPTATLGLQPGDMVRVKSYEFILSTLDEANKNRGLFFDAEMVPFCGKTYRVIKRVSQIIDEKTGKMSRFKGDSIMLENVCCESRYSDRRMFCPRAIPSLWKEIWLDRVEDPDFVPSCPQSPKPVSVTLRTPASK